MSLQKLGIITKEISKGKKHVSRGQGMRVNAVKLQKRDNRSLYTRALYEMATMRIASD
jgi:hypothetical protein